MALTLFRTGARVVLVLADSQHLVFEEEPYIQKFGSELGKSLYIKLQEELKACRDESSPSETLRMRICTVIWKQFGVQWLEVFSCIQESRKTSPEQGVQVDDLAVLSSICMHDMNVCLCVLV